MSVNIISNISYLVRSCILLRLPTLTLCCTCAYLKNGQTKRKKYKYVYKLFVSICRHKKSRFFFFLILDELNSYSTLVQITFQHRNKFSQQQVKTSRMCKLRSRGKQMHSDQRHTHTFTLLHSHVAQMETFATDVKNKINIISC